MCLLPTIIYFIHIIAEYEYRILILHIIISFDTVKHAYGYSDGWFCSAAKMEMRENDDQIKWWW